jgi:hypothetical protein
MLVCVDGLLGSRAVEESPVQQSFLHDYEITGFVKKKGFFGEISNYQLLMTDRAA